MLCVTVEIHEGTLTYRARVIAPSMEHALKIAGGGRSKRRKVGRTISEQEVDGMNEASIGGEPMGPRTESTLTNRPSCEHAYHTGCPDSRAPTDRARGERST
jgi:hypothetical protein